MLDNELTQINNSLRDALAYKKSMNIKHIYHYTSPEGLKGILDNNKIFFSNIRFLNDKSENSYIYNLFPHFEDKYRETVIDEVFFKILRQFAQDFSCKNCCKINEIIYKSQDIYVASFSLASNSLLLWNYYTKTTTGIGYRISFDNSPFSYSLQKYNLIEGKVIYERQQQEDLLKEVILKYNEYFKRHKHNLLQEKNCLKKFIESFVSIIETYNIFFKDMAYKDEEEYRFAIYNVNSEKVKVLTRILNGIFLPYISVSFDKTKISQIGISPSNDKDILKDGVGFLLKETNHIADIWNSQIPKRY